MTRPIAPALALGALGLACLAACGAVPSGDWRTQVGRPTPNAILAQPRPPLVLPPVADLPAPPGS